MGVMYICGLNMEMETAKELNLVGKCRGCYYCDYLENIDGYVACRKKGVLKQCENCDEWVVDMR